MPARPTTLPSIPSPRPWRPALVAIAALAAVTGAQAQRYTLKELKEPFSASRCELAQSPLDEAGNVAGMCLYWTGGFVFPQLQGFVVPLPRMSNKAVTWKASGSVSVSSFAAAGEISGIEGLTPSSQPIADLLARASTFEPIGSYIYNGWSWSPWKPPAPLTGAWRIVRVLENGSQLLQSEETLTKNRFAVQLGTQVTALPPVPGTWAEIGQARMNAKGQVLVQVHADPTSRDSGSSPWYWWDGVRWWPRSLGAAVPSPSSVQALDLNSAGVALLTLDETPGEKEAGTSRALLWNVAADSLEALPANLLHPIQGALNDAGVVVGETYLPHVTRLDSFDDRRAGVWRAGVMTMLDTLTTLPSGAFLERATAVNNRGQVVAYLRTPGASVFGRWVLLTPQ